MDEDSFDEDHGAVPVGRRTLLSAVSGVAIGAALPTGTASARVEGGAPVEPLTPRPATTGDGDVRSLNGAWEFALSSSETPPTSAERRVVPDRSNAGNDGVLRNGPETVTDPVEGALDLADGSYVAVGDADSVDFTEPGFTIRTTFRYAGDGPVWSKGGNQYSLGIWGGQLSFWTEGDGGWPGIDAGDLERGQWYTVTLVVDESEIRLYVGSEEVGSTDHAFSSLPSTDSPLHLGYDAGNDDDGSSVVDSFGAFDAPLPLDRIDRAYDAPPEDAVAWLPMDTVSEGTTPDESGTGNDGLLHGDPSAVPGHDGRGLDLAGDGRVRVAGDGLELSSPGFTLRARVQYDGGDGLVVGRGTSTAGTEQFGLGIYDGRVEFWLQSGGGEWPSVGGGTLSTEGWHTITAVAGADELRLFVDGERVGAESHGVDALVSSDAALAVGGDDLAVSATSVAVLGTALSADRIDRGFVGVPEAAVLWHEYSTIEDRSVEWREEEVPGQWGYDEYVVPSGSEEWYPPEGRLGWYRREFEGSKRRDERLLLRFDAVYSEARVFVNGTEVGHHVGGYTPFEINVTDVVEDGTNTLSVGVSQASPADDMGWQNVTGGITRNVTLVSVPETHVADYDVRTSLHGSSATVRVEVGIENPGAAGEGILGLTLSGPDGETVATAERSIPSRARGSCELSTVLEVADPLPWNPEQPRLYALEIDLDAAGTTERVTQRVGIREVSVAGNELRINDEAVTLRGVNWEEIHLPEHGHAIPPKLTREDARRLKEANTNYVRTAHHPTSEAFLDACDELGIVVEVEAPHMFIGRDRGDPYPEVVVDQTAEMVERDKNRPSVCLWSIANESEWYDAFETAGRLTKELDPTRPTIFNYDVYDPDHPWHDVYDVRSHHYPAFRTDSTVAEHADLADPILFDEYAHTYCYNDRELVTDPGLRDQWGIPFERIWEQCRAADAVAGGAIWAGGDHLEQWGEYLWGLLDRNRRPRPEYWHVKKVYSPVRVVDAEWLGNGNVVRLTIENRHEFVDLDERSIEFEGARSSGRRPIEAAPGERVTVTVPVEDDRLELRVAHPEGHMIERAVFTPDSPESEDRPEPAGAVLEADEESVWTTEGLPLSVDRETGRVEIRPEEGTPIVTGGPELALTPTQAETGREYEEAIDHRPDGRTVTGVEPAEDGAAVAIDVEYGVAAGTFVLRPLEEGVEVEYEFALKETVDAREVGVALPLAEDLTTLSWRREGQWSTYPDDHIGRTEGTADAFPDGSRPDHEEIRLGTDRPWKDDATSHGSNDFRGTKRNVYAAELTGQEAGVRLLSAGDHHVRAQVRSGSVDLLALERSLSGTNGDGWLDRQPVLDEEPTLEAGETVRGSVIFEIVNLN